MHRSSLISLYYFNNYKNNNFSSHIYAWTNPLRLCWGHKFALKNYVRFRVLKLLFSLLTFKYLLCMILRIEFLVCTVYMYFVFLEIWFLDKGIVDGPLFKLFVSSFRDITLCSFIISVISFFLTFYLLTLWICLIKHFI
jgi:hypothetical protein